MAASVVDEVVKKPHEGGAVGRLAAAEVLEILDEGVMIAYVPIRHIAAPGVGKLAYGLAVAPGLLDGGLPPLYGQHTVLLGLVVIQHRKQELRSALEVFILGKGEEPVLDPAQLGLAYKGAVVYVVFQPVELLLRGHGEERVYRDAEEYRYFRQELHVRHAGSELPLADCLRRHVERGGQRLLRDAAVVSQAAYFFSHFHDGSLLLFHGLILADSRQKNQLPLRESARTAVERRSERGQGSFLLFAIESLTAFVVYCI